MRGDFCPTAREAALRISERTGPNAVGGAQSASRAGGASSRFTLSDTAGSSRSSAAQAAAPAGALDGLLAVQAAGDSLERRKRAMRRGHGILDGLDRLKIALLSGNVTGADLLRLRQQLMERREQSDDAGLDDILAHVDLRAEVELAKLAKR